MRFTFVDIGIERLAGFDVMLKVAEAIEAAAGRQSSRQRTGHTAHRTLAVGYEIENARRGRHANRDR
jgi:hypothetical protein